MAHPHARLLASGLVVLSLAATGCLSRLVDIPVLQKRNGGTPVAAGEVAGTEEVIDGTPIFAAPHVVEQPFPPAGEVSPDTELAPPPRVLPPTPNASPMPYRPNPCE